MKVEREKRGGAGGGKKRIELGLASCGRDQEVCRSKYFRGRVALLLQGSTTLVAVQHEESGKRKRWVPLAGGQPKSRAGRKLGGGAAAVVVFNSDQHCHRGGKRVCTKKEDGGKTHRGPTWIARFFLLEACVCRAWEYTQHDDRAAPTEWMLGQGTSGNEMKKKKDRYLQTRILSRPGGESATRGTCDPTPPQILSFYLRAVVRYGTFYCKQKASGVPDQPKERPPTKDQLLFTTRSTK